MRLNRNLASMLLLSTPFTASATCPDYARFVPEVILDEGVVGPPPQERDFQFEADSPTERHLTPANGSEVAIVGTAPVGRNGCEDASLSANRIDIDSLLQGTFVCSRTSEGRLSEFQVLEPAGPSPGTLVIRYRTWPLLSGP